MDFLYFVLPALVLFCLGAAVGSFLNVVIYRSTRGQNWVKGRSRCESCRKTIAWYDNIPLLSFVLLRGRCRHCQKQLSIGHPVVESLTGILFVWWYIAGFMFFQLAQQPFNILQPLFWLAVGLILLVITVVDFKQMIIPDSAVVVLFILTLLYRLGLTGMGVMQVVDLRNALISMVAGGLFFFFLWLGTKGRGMGFGDVKLAFPLALLLGWPKVLIWVFLAFTIGAVVGVTLMALGRVKFKQAVPFGPFMVIATVLSLIWGDALLSWYWGLLG
ncbi:MAG: prepilin peptidase [Patescibacteria group bacterium]